MNDQAVIQLLKRVLTFYAEEKNYEPDGLIHADRGGMARGVLETINSAGAEMDKIKREYEKLQEEIQANPELSEEDIEDMKKIQDLLNQMETLKKTSK